MFFFDEGRFGLRSTVMRIWSKRGIPVKVKVKQGFKSFYVYTSISPFNGNNFSLILPGIGADMMNIYIEELSKELKGKNVLIIMDQAGWHKCKELNIPDNIKIIFLPPYSPELNPVERFWKEIKKDVVHNKVFETIEDLMDVVSEKIKVMTDDRIQRLCTCSYLQTYK